jgi:hypothetical protein
MQAQVIDLGYRPREWQANSHRAMKRFNIRVIHRRGGKTVKAVMTLVDAALRTKKQAARYAYIAPLLKQAKAVAWDYLRHYGSKVPGCKINLAELSVEFPNGSRITLYGADNPDGLRGIYLDGVVMDEVAQMKPEMWGEIIQPALSDRIGWALFIGTPKGINLFSELYYKHQEDPEWSCMRLTCYDTDALAPSEIERLKSNMTDNEFRQEMLCDFSASSTDNLISIDLVEQACKRHLREDQYLFAPKILGVDVAFAEDGDRSVIQPRQGLAAFKPKFWRGMDNMTLADQVARAWDAWKADACFIDAGRGEGVYSRLIQLGFSPAMVNFGGQSFNPVYANKRTEMWFELANWLKQGGAIPNIAELKQDLCAPTYDSDRADNRLQLERKEKIKERGLPSPDLADALALTFAATVMPQMPPGLQHRNHAATEYDPIHRQEEAHATTEYNPFA